ncbi:MAG: hypothetical protein ABW195_18245 [Ilumatobacteraceae bacterium]
MARAGEGAEHLHHAVADGSGVDTVAVIVRTRAGWRRAIAAVARSIHGGEPAGRSLPVLPGPWAAIGHSSGGGAAVELAARGTLAAAVSLDGTGPGGLTAMSRSPSTVLDHHSRSATATSPTHRGLATPSVTLARPVGPTITACGALVTVVGFVVQGAATVLVAASGLLMPL